MCVYIYIYIYIYGRARPEYMLHATHHVLVRVVQIKITITYHRNKHMMCLVCRCSYAASY